MAFGTLCARRRPSVASFAHWWPASTPDQTRRDHRGYLPPQLLARRPPLDHVEFVFKYENLSLDLLEQVFRKIPAADVDGYLAASPHEQIAGRRIGVLYEFLKSQPAQDGGFRQLRSRAGPEEVFYGQIPA